MKEEIVDEISETATVLPVKDVLHPPADSLSGHLGSGRRKQTLRGVPAPGTLVRKIRQPTSTSFSHRFARNCLLPLGGRPLANLKPNHQQTSSQPPQSTSPPAPTTQPPQPKRKSGLSARATRLAKRQAKRGALEGVPLPAQKQEEPLDSALEVESVPMEGIQHETGTPPPPPLAVTASTLLTAPPPTAAVGGPLQPTRSLPPMNHSVRPSIMRTPPSIVRRSAKLSMTRFGQSLLRSPSILRTQQRSVGEAKTLDEPSSSKTVNTAEENSDKEAKPDIVKVETNT